jgi:nitrogen-specific signal transduction histidine kinase
LALVRQIIDAHHGVIDIVSEESRGALFLVSLPGRAGVLVRGVVAGGLLGLDVPAA